MEKKKVSKHVPVQSIIPRPLYAELVKRCAERDETIKGIVNLLIEDFVKAEKFATREWQMSDENYKEAMTAYENYIKIRDDVEKENEKI